MTFKCVVVLQGGFKTTNESSIKKNEGSKKYTSVQSEKPRVLSNTKGSIKKNMRVQSQKNEGSILQIESNVYFIAFSLKTHYFIGMPSRRITSEFKNKIHFITFTIKNWYYIFDRHSRFHILEDCFIYCQKHKNLKIYAFVFMLNHLHFISSAPDLIAVVRDMKTFLSKELKKNILSTEPTVLRIFENKGKSTFWKNTNYPELIFNEKFFKQKMDYIHFNPVRKQYVHLPEDWRWSSASKIPSKIELSVVS